MAGEDYGDALELAEAYFERGWTDGLPVVPPTDIDAHEGIGGTRHPRPDPDQGLQGLLSGCRLWTRRVGALFGHACRRHFDLV